MNALSRKSHEFATWKLAAALWAIGLPCGAVAYSGHELIVFLFVMLPLCSIAATLAMKFVPRAPMSEAEKAAMVARVAANPARKWRTMTLEELDSSHNHGPTHNIDGTPMIGGAIDMNGNGFGFTNND
jgi:hypothetical protein